MIFIIMKNLKNRIKNQLLEHSRGKLFKVIESKYYYSTYQDVFFVGTYDECVDFIVNERRHDLEIQPFGGGNDENEMVDESVTKTDGKVEFDYETNDEDSNINTRLGISSKNFKFKPRIKTLPKSGVKVLSVYQKTSNKETTEIIKDLKRGTPERGLSVQEDDYNSFLTRTAIFYGRVLKDMDIDTIFTMESKSSLSKDLTSKIKTILPNTTIKVLDNSIVKDIKNIKLNREGAKLSDYEYKLLGDIYNDVRTKGEFSLKKIHPKHRSLFTDWIKVNEDSIRDVTDKNIIVIDDYITSGVTLDEVCLQLLKLSPKSILCLTILK